MTIDPRLIQEIEPLFQTLSVQRSEALLPRPTYSKHIFLALFSKRRALKVPRSNSKTSPGNRPRRLIFRSSPGHIYSDLQPYAHAVISFTGKGILEAHIGVRVAGKSGVLHECDVAVIDQDEADTCRWQKVPPRSYRVLLAVECKFYSTLLQLNLGRSFIGLTTDISATETFFVTNTSSDSVERLLTKRRKSWERNVVPAATLEVNGLKNDFQRCFRDYKVR